MVFLEGILAWLLKQVLSYLLGLAVTSAEEHAAQVAEDKQRGIVDAENVRKYDEAKDRVERRRAALDLLNRNSAP